MDVSGVSILSEPQQEVCYWADRAGRYEQLIKSEAWTVRVGSFLDLLQPREGSQTRVLTHPAAKRFASNRCESPCILREWTGMRPLHSCRSFGLWFSLGCFDWSCAGISLWLVTWCGDTLQSLTFVFQQRRIDFGLLDFNSVRPRRECDCNGHFPSVCATSRTGQDGRLQKPIHAQGKTRHEREHPDKKAEQHIVRLWRIKTRHVHQRERRKPLLIHH